jgi:hypothetical protein
MAFRSDNLSTSGTNSDTTLTAPTGLANDDIIIIGLYIENDVTPTPPTGFAQICDIDHGSVALDLWVWWKRASGESGNYTVSHASAYRQGWIAAFSGRTTTGDPQDATASTNTGTGTTVTYTGLTPAGDDADIICINGTFDSVASGNVGGTAPTFTEQADDSNNIHAYTGTQTTAAAVGNRTSTVGSTSWAATMIALRSATPGGGGVTTRRYSLSLTGVG